MLQLYGGGVFPPSVVYHMDAECSYSRVRLLNYFKAPSLELSKWIGVALLG